MTQSDKTFKCINCGRSVPSESIGTKNRNHCPFCLYSIHVDELRPGDRLSHCLGSMKPLGLVFKTERLDKYGHAVTGELSIVHKCQKCGKINYNRVAGDDKSDSVVGLFNYALYKDTDRQDAEKILNIHFLDRKDEPELRKQLYGITS